VRCIEYWLHKASEWGALNWMSGGNNDLLQFQSVALLKCDQLILCDLLITLVML